MPTLALIERRTAEAFGLTSQTLHLGSEEAAFARRCVAWLAVDVCGHAVDRVGLALGRSNKTVLNSVGSIRADRRAVPDTRLKLDRLAVEICAEALAAAALRLPLPADPDPARTAAQLLAGGPAAATVSEDALRGLALAFLALAAGTPSTAVQEDHHAQGQG